MAIRGTNTSRLNHYAAVQSQEWSLAVWLCRIDGDVNGGNLSPLELYNNNQYAMARCQIKPDAVYFFDHSAFWFGFPHAMPSSGAWLHVGVSYLDRVYRVYRNGIAGSTGTLHANFATRNWGSGGANPILIYETAARIADAGLWRVALQADDFKMLSIGISPKKVRTDDLVLHCPCISTTQNTFGGTTSSPAGGYYAHPRIFCP